jgi:hypothetical protein
MRGRIAFAIIIVSIALGGCFHHGKSVGVEALPPPVAHPPLK